MLVLQNVPVHTNAEIGRRGLIGNTGHFVVFMIGLADTRFEDGEPLVVQVDSQGTLIFTVVAQNHHSWSNEVKRHGESSEEGDGVLFQTEHLHLCLRCHRQDQHEQANGDSS